jgi:hypothetical protein
MPLTVLDPCTGNRATIGVPARSQSRRIRRWVLRELDRVADQRSEAAKGSFR